MPILQNRQLPEESLGITWPVGCGSPPNMLFGPTTRDTRRDILILARDSGCANNRGRFDDLLTIRARVEGRSCTVPVETVTDEPKCEKPFAPALTSQVSCGKSA